DNYIKTINVELNTAVEMVERSILPAGIKYIGRLAKGNYFCEQAGTISQTAVKSQRDIANLIDKVSDQCDELKAAQKAALSEASLEQKATEIHRVYSILLADLRQSVDTLETLMPKKDWPMPDYTDLLFYL
ncbi:MAG: hypothetical protein RSA20_09190, partial [Oscillospiraceae bacterium]